MSKYEWEEGSFKLTGPEYNKFKREFVATLNAAIVSNYEKANILIAALLAEQKGKRNVDWVKALSEKYEKELDSLPCRDSRHYGPIGSAWALNRVVFKLGPDARTLINEKPSLLKKKDQLLLVLKNEKLSVHDNYSEARVVFDDASKTIRWSVSENNHAVETAHDSFLGRTFFSQLQKVTWGRTSGGEIWGNDEYNRDSARDYADGGGNYVSMRVGINKVKFEQQWNAPARRVARKSPKTVR